jgi:membrane protein YqaA with SNARE-associated domain
MYDWTLKISGKKHALFALCVIAFIESSFFPIPPYLFLIPLVLARRQDAFKIAFWATLSSVLGGFLGYGIGMFLYDTVGRWLLDLYNMVPQFERLREQYNEWGAWLIVGSALTPIPYKLITIASGVAGLDLLTFTLSSLVARGFRMFLVAGLLWKFGPPMKVFIEKNLGWLSVLFLVLFVAGFAILKFI